MCLICVEFEKGKLSADEAWKNLNELGDTIDPQHAIEVIKKLWESGNTLDYVKSKEVY